MIRRGPSKKNKPKFFMSISGHGVEIKDDTGALSIGTTFLRCVSGLGKVPDLWIGQLTREMPSFAADIWLNRRHWPMEYGLPIAGFTVTVRVEK